ncbi:MAG: PAS domain S-box protein [Verrucomicrobia bacterium]|nr:PAS domain S-box protein [Verrucomicrobiota bacterium]
MSEERNSRDASEARPQRHRGGWFPAAVSALGLVVILGGAWLYYTQEPERIKAASAAALALAALAGIAWFWREREGRRLRQELAVERERQVLAQRIADLTQHANDIVLFTDQDWRILEANDRAVEAYGYSLPELRRLTIRDLRAPETLPEIEGHAELVTLQRRAVLETKHRRKDGSTFPVEASVCALEMEGREFHQSIIRDITDRRQAQERLEQSLSLLRATLESTADGILVVDTQGRISSLNRKFAEMWRLPDAVLQSGDDNQALAHVLDQLLDPDAFLAKVRALYGQPEADSFDVLSFKDGRTFERYSHPQRLGPQVVGRVWSFRDITERRKQERELDRYHRLYAALSQVNQAIVRVRTREELFHEISRVIVEYGGFKMSWIGWVDEDTRELMTVAHAGEGSETWPGILASAGDGSPGRGPTGATVRDGQACILNDLQHEDPSVPWRAEALRRGLRAAAFFPIRAREKARGVLAAFAAEPGVFGDTEIDLLKEAAGDISFALDLLEKEAQRKRAEEALRASEAKLKESQRVAHIGHYSFDAASGAWTSSEALDEIFGIGKDFARTVEGWLQIVHPEDRQEMEDYFARTVLEQGQPFDRDYRIRRVADQEARWMHGLGRLELGADGRVAAMFGTIQDVTERKRAEEALRESLAEKIALLKEVHHRVKNNLQIVASLLNLQAGRAQNPQVLDVLQDTRNRVRSMALLHEALYRSGTLARINFPGYVADLCAQLLRSFGPVGARVALECRVARLGLPLEQSVPCGLIINELVSNALKHGFPGERAGRIIVELKPSPESAGGEDDLFSLQSQRKDPEEGRDQPSPPREPSLVLRVSDDGVGLPPGLDPASTSTLGLQLVSNLADQLKGHFTVERGTGEGAAFSVVFPVPDNTAPHSAS